jgi:hypothetical protein
MRTAATLTHGAQEWSGDSGRGRTSCWLVGRDHARCRFHEGMVPATQCIQWGGGDERVRADAVCVSSASGASTRRSVWGTQCCPMCRARAVRWQREGVRYQPHHASVHSARRWARMRTAATHTHGAQEWSGDSGRGRTPYCWLVGRDHARCRFHAGMVPATQCIQWGGGGRASASRCSVRQQRVGSEHTAQCVGTQCCPMWRVCGDAVLSNVPGVCCAVAERGGEVPATPRQCAQC